MDPLAARPRRLRRTAGLRRLVRETRLGPESLVYPLFVRAGRNVREEVPALPGVFRHSPDELVRDVDEARRLGVRAVLLFGLPERKDERGTEASDPRGAVQQAVRALKEVLPDVVVMTDVCLCAYTSHGHCGVVREGGERDGRVANDETLGILGRVAVSQAEAGADLVAPSALMDGQVAAIRAALDSAGLGEETGVLSYAAKYASAFYGPFRDAAQSAPRAGDRRGYQMDPANAREALREIRLDLEEGADIVMVKPALPYLDVIARARAGTDVPIAAYHVSGEYAMVKAAARLGWLDERRAALEMLAAIRRAGADLVITYYAKEAARWLREEEA